MRACLFILLTAATGVACTTTVLRETADKPDAAVVVTEPNTPAESASHLQTDASTGCNEMQRSVGGVCTFVPVARLSLGLRGDDGGDIYAEANELLTYSYSTYAETTPPLGTCAVTTGSGTSPTENGAFTLLSADLGSVSVVGPFNGTDVFQRQLDPDKPAYVSSLPVDVAPFRGGEDLVFDTTGGADFPATHLTMTMPQPILLYELPTLTPGADYAVRWTGAGDPGDTGTILLRITTETASNSVIATCAATDNGAFTVPASITAQLIAPEDADFAVTRIDRIVSQRQEPAAKNVIVEWQAWTTEERPLSYK